MSETPRLYGMQPGDAPQGIDILLSKVPLPLQIRYFMYLDAAENGGLQQVILEAIRGALHRPTSPQLLRGRLHIAAESGNIGDAAAISSALLRRSQVTLTEGATSMATANSNAKPLYDQQLRQTRNHIGSTILQRLHPNQWKYLMREADLEVDVHHLQARAGRWARYAHLAGGPTEVKGT